MRLFAGEKLLDTPRYFRATQGRCILMTLGRMAQTLPLLLPISAALLTPLSVRTNGVRMSVGIGPGEPQPSAAPIYRKIDELLRRSEQSPSVRALKSHWLTMAPGELVENTLVIGRSLVGNFDKGAELLDCAEEQTGASLSPRAYGALARLGEDEQRHAEVLALLGRMRAAGGEPGPSMLLTAMRAAAQLGDWGGVSRLFAEYAGTDDAVEALELIGDVSVVREMEAELRGGFLSTRSTKLTMADTEALRLALHAHCARGDMQVNPNTRQKKTHAGSAVQ